MPSSGQTFAHHPQIGQREQRVQLRCVLGQAAVAPSLWPNWRSDDAERVLSTLARMLALMRST